jgi:hypothetical protein
MGAHVPSHKSIRYPDLGTWETIAVFRRHDPDPWPKEMNIRVSLGADGNDRLSSTFAHTLDEDSVHFSLSRQCYLHTASRLSASIHSAKIVPAAKHLCDPLLPTNSD